MQKRQVKMLSAVLVLVVLAILAMPAAAMAEDEIALQLNYIVGSEATMNISGTTATVDVG